MFPDALRLEAVQSERLGFMQCALFCGAGFESLAEQWQAAGCDVVVVSHPAPRDDAFEAGFDAVVTNADIEALPLLARLLRDNGRLIWAPPDGNAPFPDVDGLCLYREDPSGLRVAVSAGYDPLSHGRALRELGMPGWANELLGRVPLEYLGDIERITRLFVERERCLMDWADRVEPHARLGLFFEGQMEFFRATFNNASLHEAYLAHAEFWSRLGDDRMARRMVETIHFAMPDPVCEQALLRYTAPAPGYETTTAPFEVGAPDQAGTMPRVLLLVSDAFDVTLDVLHHGLCNVLGDDNVVEFPWKPQLHGVDPKQDIPYPNLFHHAGEPLEVRELCAELRAGRFDFILFADVRATIPREQLDCILEADANLPLYAVDTWDDCCDLQPFLAEHLRRRPAAYFKREMLECHDYGSRAIPLPLCYPDARVPRDVSAPRTQPIFWAGRPEHGLRPIVLGFLETALGLALDRSYTQEEYSSALLVSATGISLCGFGFDCVRYWELPIHGCLLVAEKMPIRVPYNFRDGESAVFFNDLRELVEKLEYYLSHPNAILAVAAQGRKEALEHHTASARARQLLAHVDRLRPEDGP